MFLFFGVLKNVLNITVKGLKIMAIHWFFVMFHGGRGQHKPCYISLPELDVQPY